MAIVTKRNILKWSVAGTLILPLRTFALINEAPQRAAKAVLRKEYPSTAYAWTLDHQRSALTKNLANFFGNARGGYLSPFDLNTMDTQISVDDLSVRKQFSRALVGPPHPEIYPTPGYRMLGASLPHQSTVKAFVLTGGNSVQIVATALLHSNCGKLVYGDLKRQISTNSTTRATDRVHLSQSTQNRRTQVIDESPILTIFFSNRVAKNYQIADLFVQHARSILEEQNYLPGMPSAVKTSKLRAEIRMLKQA